MNIAHEIANVVYHFLTADAELFNIHDDLLQVQFGDPCNWRCWNFSFSQNNIFFLSFSHLFFSVYFSYISLRYFYIYIIFVYFYWQNYFIYNHFCNNILHFFSLVLIIWIQHFTQRNIFKHLIFQIYFLSILLFFIWNLYYINSKYLLTTYYR